MWCTLLRQPSIHNARTPRNGCGLIVPHPHAHTFKMYMSAMCGSENLILRFNNRNVGKVSAYCVCVSTAGLAKLLINICAITTRFNFRVESVCFSGS